MEYLFSLHCIYRFTITSFYDAYMIRLSVTFPVKENYIAGGRLIAPLLPLTFYPKPVNTIADKRRATSCVLAIVEISSPNESARRI